MMKDADRILDLERQLEEQKAVADTSRKMWAVSKILYSQRNVALAEKQRQLQIDRSAMQAESGKTIEVAVKRSEESKQSAIQGADRNLKEKTRELELVKQQLSTSRDGNAGLTKQNKVLEIKNAELAQTSKTLLDRNKKLDLDLAKARDELRHVKDANKVHFNDYRKHAELASDRVHDFQELLDLKLQTIHQQLKSDPGMFLPPLPPAVMDASSCVPAPGHGPMSEDQLREFLLQKVDDLQLH